MNSSGTRPLLRISGLRGLFSNPLDLSLHAGECISVNGPSGCGKTRLLRAIADLEAFEAEIWLEGQERNSMPANEWRKQVCFVPAETAWWAESVAEHFSDHCEDDWLKALEMPKESLQWAVARLSTGEKQRLSLLRTLVLKPRVLLLDEPTANLDPENTGNVERLLLSYLQEEGAAALWISHDEAQRSRIAGRHLNIHNLQWEVSQ